MCQKFILGKWHLKIRNLHLVPQEFACDFHFFKGGVDFFKQRNLIGDDNYFLALLTVMTP